MSNSTSMADLLQQAEDAGFGGILSDGVYQLSVGAVNFKARQDGGAKLGIQFKVVSGPDTGSSWYNTNLIPGGKGNGFFFELLNDLGIPNEHILQLAPLASDLTQLVEHIKRTTAGQVFTATVGSRTWGTNNDKTDNTFKFGGAAAAPAAAVPAAAPVAAPVAVAPVAVAPVAVAPVAVAPVAVEPVAVAAAPAPVPVAPVAVAAPVPVAPVAVDPLTGLPPRPGGGI